jgi:phosphoglycolate phosphatase
VQQILEHFELIHFFSDVFGSELDGTRTNKSELLQYALSETEISASHATMIGDRKHDIIGALENGIAPVGVLYGYGSADELREAGANRFANAPNELVALLL